MKRFREEHPYCPWFHPRFEKGGCISYIQTVSDEIRNQIDYGSEEFRKIYHLRTSSERIFSRLLNLYMEKPGVRGLNAISNCATISHITVLLVALVAIKTGKRDKIRLVKSLLPYL